MNRYVEVFRELAPARALVRRVTELAKTLPRDRLPFRIMEVCGTHTMTIARSGLRDLLPAEIELISGPGCPVCVTDPGYLDAAIELAKQGFRILTFGDLIRAPGSTRSLADARAEGADIVVCYSPLEAIESSRAAPGRPCVFLAIGFETTMAPVLAALETAIHTGLDNFTILTAFKRILPALEALVQDPTLRIDAFILPGHVSAIIGAESYRPFVKRHQLPCVIAGFEPLDVLYAIEGVLRQALAGTATVDNQYSRVVRPGGNQRARDIIERYLEPEDVAWRGLGVIPASGMRLRDNWSAWDAARRWGMAVRPGQTDPACRCGDVLRGALKPEHCPLFGSVCTPDRAVGPCMVSSEGSCAAAFRYRIASCSTAGSYEKRF